MSKNMEVLVIGAGIGGLTMALALHQAGIACRLFEAAPAFKPLGVGLNLLPHAVKELDKLGIVPNLLAKGIETAEYCFYTRHGQLVYREPRGRAAGYEVPQISIHRADLHQVLSDAVYERMGKDAIVLGHRNVMLDQDETGVIAHFVDTVTGEPLPPVRGTIAIACDGVNSVTRSAMHPKEAKPRYEGTTQYRGSTVWKPFLTGRSMLYFGTYETGKLIIYPMRDNVDAQGNQLINWVVEISRDDLLTRDWNKTSDVEEFIEHFEQMKFDFLDVPGVLRGAKVILEYPMIDQDPLSHWTEGRITLLGDAAHPMMPRGSNGSAQAIIDANTLAAELAVGGDPRDALRAYEAKRLPASSSVVMANRGQAPDAILRVVEERTGGRPFARIEDVISQEELVEWQENYRKLAGFRAQDLNVGA